MYSHLFPRRRVPESSLKLANGGRVAVIGGGPAGSFFSYFLLDMAHRVGLDLTVDIYEARDFSLPAPQGCNMCAGVISETLVQNLAMEGIHLPAPVIQKGINSYVLHTDLGSQRIQAAAHEKRIGAAFRGGGPSGCREVELRGLDGYLLSMAEQKGASVIRARVNGVERVGDRVQVKARSAKSGTASVGGEYDLLAVAAGVNTAALKLFEQQDWQYQAPKTTRTALREYCLGKEAVEKHFGNTLHVFLLDIPRLDFAMIVPKGEYVSVCLLGKDVDEPLIQAFLTAPEVKSCFPDGWRSDQPACQCLPRINVDAARFPYADRVVFIGDSGVTRLYKDGIGSAYRSAKAAAATAVLQGISAADFKRFYAPFCRRMEVDNQFGRLFFGIAHRIQKIGLSRRAMLHMAAAEQESDCCKPLMSSVLWDAFTGSAPYRDVFLRTFQPGFIYHYGASWISVWTNRPVQCWSFRSESWKRAN